MWKIRNKINELQKRNEIPKYQKVKVKNETDIKLDKNILTPIKIKTHGEAIINEINK